MKVIAGELVERTRGLWDQARDGVTGVAQRLRSTDPVDDLDDVEDAVKEALQPVPPADDFRQNLRSGLSRAQYARRSGITVSDPPPYREGIVLGMVTTVIAVSAMLLWLIHRLRGRQGAASR